MFEIDFEECGSPYSTVYVDDQKWGIETPGGMVWQFCPPYLTEALRKYKEENNGKGKTS